MSEWFTCQSKTNRDIVFLHSFILPGGNWQSHPVIAVFSKLCWTSHIHLVLKVWKLHMSHVLLIKNYSISMLSDCDWNTHTGVQSNHMPEGHRVLQNTPISQALLMCCLPLVLTPLWLLLPPGPLYPKAFPNCLSPHRYLLSAGFFSSRLIIFSFVMSLNG